MLYFNIVILSTITVENETSGLKYIIFSDFPRKKEPNLIKVFFFIAQRAVKTGIIENSLDQLKKVKVLLVS